jgi:hypothetical protein
MDGRGSCTIGAASIDGEGVPYIIVHPDFSCRSRLQIPVGEPCSDVAMPEAVLRPHQVAPQHHVDLVSKAQRLFSVNKESKNQDLNASANESIN